MSRLEELIQQLCPDGVEYKNLGDVCSYATERIDASEVNANNYVGVENLLPDKQGKTVASYVPNDGRWIHFRKDDILLGNIRPYLKKIWLATHDGGTNGDVLVIQIKNKNILRPRFLYYILSSDSFFNYDMQNAKGAKMPRGNKSAVLRYPLSLPPLPVQQEIVRILDTLTELTAELNEKLTAELTARKKQYEYYRDELLTKSNAPKVELRRVVKKSCSGATPAKGHGEYYENGTIPWLRTQDVRFNEIYDIGSYITEVAVKETAAKWIPENCVIVAISGASAGRCAINKIRTTTNQHCLNMEIDNSKALYKYVYYCVSSQYQELLSRKQGARGDLNSSLILGMQIPVPSLEEQHRIVSILDRFDALCNDLTSGLPAEIEARQKQYEYYRDKLLSFKVKGSDSFRGE